MKPTGLVGKTVQESVAVFPPFSSAYGENMTPGKDIVINTGCSFQDTGGITTGDGTLIGHRGTRTRLNQETPTGGLTCSRHRS